MNTTHQCSVRTEVLQTGNLWLPLNMCMSETEAQVSTRELSLAFTLNNLVGVYQCCGGTHWLYLLAFLLHYTVSYFMRPQYESSLPQTLTPYLYCSFALTAVNREKCSLFI